MSEIESKELLDTAKNQAKKIDDLTTKNQRLKQKLERMNELLLLAQRARFGQSSEKR